MATNLAVIRKNAAGPTIPWPYDGLLYYALLMSIASGASVALQMRVGVISPAIAALAS